MGWRYRKSIKLMPGVKLNISKRGFSSVSLGRPGYTVNLNSRGAKHTFGLPGTGLSYSTERRATSGVGGGLFGFIVVAFLVACLWAAISSDRPPKSAASAPSAEKYLSEALAPVRDDAHPIVQLPPTPEVVPALPPPLATPALAPPLPVPAAEQIPAPIDTVEKTTVQIFANVRSQPSREGVVLQQVQVGDELSIVDRSGSWVKVRRGETVLGWVHRNMLSR